MEGGLSSFRIPKLQAGARNTTQHVSPYVSPLNRCYAESPSSLRHTTQHVSPYMSPLNRCYAESPSSFTYNSQQRVFKRKICETQRNRSSPSEVTTRKELVFHKEKSRKRCQTDEGEAEKGKDSRREEVRRTKRRKENNGKAQESKQDSKKEEYRTSEEKENKKNHGAEKEKESTTPKNCAKQEDRQEQFTEMSFVCVSRAEYERMRNVWKTIFNKKTVKE